MKDTRENKEGIDVRQPWKDVKESLWLSELYTTFLFFSLLRRFLAFLRTYIPTRRRRAMYTIQAKKIWKKGIKLLAFFSVSLDAKLLIKLLFSSFFATEKRKMNSAECFSSIWVMRMNLLALFLSLRHSLKKNVNQCIKTYQLSPLAT